MPSCNMQPLTDQAAKAKADDHNNKTFCLQGHLNAQCEGTKPKTFGDSIFSMSANTVENQA